MYFYTVSNILSIFEQLLDVHITPLLTYSVMKARSNFIETQD